VSHSAPATIQAIAVDRRGNIYATDALKLRIDRLSPSGKTLSPWGGFGSAPGKFELPEGIAADAAGHIYVADLKRIEKLSPGGKPLATWKGSATGIAVDRHGDIYAAERDRIVKLSHSGKVLAVWGKRGTSHVKLKLARWLAVDARGNVYVSDTVRAQGSHSWQRVQKLSSAGKVLGSWQLARDQAIGGIAVDTRGNVYVSSGDVSGGSHTTVTPPRITKYSSTGKVLAVWT
jgi:sugar lactone lactonase YvrE